MTQSTLATRIIIRFNTVPGPVHSRAGPQIYLPPHFYLPVGRLPLSTFRHDVAITPDNQNDESHDDEQLKRHLRFCPGTHTAMAGPHLHAGELHRSGQQLRPFRIGSPVCHRASSLTAPAYGWAERLEYRDGIVYAAPRQVNPAFAEAFNAGSYKKRSLSIYQPDSPGNPKPGHYARHVGFLGLSSSKDSLMRSSQRPVAIMARWNLPCRGRPTTWPACFSRFVTG
jgi:hypothetical protein